MSKFFLTLLIIFLVISGVGFYVYKITGYAFGLDSITIFKGSISLTSQDISNGNKIPSDYTCDGQDLSPTLFLEHVPSDAKSLAVILEDADSTPANFTHWLAFNINPDTATLEGSKVLGNAMVGTNDYGSTEYDGPCPPAGQTHRYYFRVYALDTMLNIDQSAKRGALTTAMNSHIIGTGELMGTYAKVAN